MKNHISIEKLNELGIPDERLPMFSPQFCKDIESRARRRSKLRVWQILRHSEFWGDDEVLKYLESERVKIWGMIKGNNDSFFFSIKDIQENLTSKLAFIFNYFPMSEATGVEYSNALKEGEYEYNDTTKKIIVPYDPGRPVEEQRFNFADLLYFGPIVEHIELSLTYIHLCEEEAAFKERQITDLNKMHAKVRNLK